MDKIPPDGCPGWPSGRPHEHFLEGRPAASYTAP
jgi:hypothetical protein